MIATAAESALQKIEGDNATENPMAKSTTNSFLHECRWFICQDNCLTVKQKLYPSVDDDSELTSFGRELRRASCIWIYSKIISVHGQKD